jgi:hypothetical protein
MKRTTLWIVAISVLIGASAFQASGPVEVYAIVDKVIFEPDESGAQRVQIWGVFSLRGATSGDVQSGYLYYRMNLPPRCATDKAACSDIEKSTRVIWSDIKTIAGTGQAIGFGGNIGTPNPGRVRKASESPEWADPFPLGNPVVPLGASSTEIVTRLRAAHKK